MPDKRLLLGVIGRPHGVRGLVHVASYTADPSALAEYGPLEDERGRRFVLRWRGKGIADISELNHGVPIPVRDRDTAAKLTNVRLFIDRDRLPPPDEEEFYLADLIGLDAVDTGGAKLGTIAAVHDYGAGASLEIARAEAPPLLVPFTRAAVPGVDPAVGRVTVAPPHEIVANDNERTA
ncbi:MAG TPA: ribosome maturation factor RimM [Acidisphaera sp.]|nr:ribosome maturation factor RimM [Acidisphaera sp.]